MIKITHQFADGLILTDEEFREKGILIDLSDPNNADACLQFRKIVSPNDFFRVIERASAKNNRKILEDFVLSQEKI